LLYKKSSVVKTLLDNMPQEIGVFLLDSVHSVLATRIVGEENNFVDSLVLCACWPREFEEVRVLVLIPRKERSGRELPPTFVLFDPCNDASNPQRIEVVLRLNDGHYTMLQGQSIADIQRTRSDAFGFEIVVPENFLQNGQWKPGRMRCSFRDLEIS
jgi:hypothetical protein